MAAAAAFGCFMAAGLFRMAAAVLMAAVLMAAVLMAASRITGSSALSWCTMMLRVNILTCESFGKGGDESAA